MKFAVESWLKLFGKSPLSVFSIASVFERSRSSLPTGVR